MKRDKTGFISAVLCCGLGLVLWACSPSADQVSARTTKERTSPPDYAIVIHGGAGNLQKANLSSEDHEAYTTALNGALDIGERILQEGGSSLDAVEQTIIYLENSPLFNAGKGAVFTHEGINELDASIMVGDTRQAGAVGGVTVVKNPIRAARAVMEKSPHVLLVGRGAEAFAISNGIDTVSNAYFFVQSRWNALEQIKATEATKTGMAETHPDSKYGTVGCVALDRAGNISAGTSTGGMTNKRYNRIGDSPIIAAGTYADNATCGVSCTGHGEYFIRYAVAYDLSARMAYQDMSLQAAADLIIGDKLKAAGGNGGLIAIDADGNIAMPFNTLGMLRGYARPGERVIGID